MRSAPSGSSFFALVKPPRRYTRVLTELEGYDPDHRFSQSRRRNYSKTIPQLLISASSSSRHTSSLAKQGILLVAVFLLYEVGFIGTLAWLLAQAEAEGAKQEFNRQLGEKADRLMLIGYDRGDSVGRYSRILESGATQATSISAAEVPSLIAWLKDAFNDRPQAKALVEKIEREVAICAPVTNDLQHNSPGASAEARLEWDKKREKIQPVVNQLLLDCRELNRITKIVHSDAPELERQKRELAVKVLLVGMFINLLAAVSIAFLVISRITSKLDVLTDNTVRLKQNQELRPPLGGVDEISALDAAFHDTADALRHEMLVLKAGEERIKALIEKVPVCIVLLDKSGAIELVNDSVESVFKYSSHQLLGKKLSKLFVPGQAVVEGAPHSSQSQNAFKHSVELTAMNKDGEHLPVDFMLAEIQLEGESKTLAMILDATEKYKVRKLRQDFVFMVRSELKEPLTRVSSFLARFGDGGLGEISAEGTTTTKAMQQNVERLIVLLNDLFDLEKLEAGTIEIEPADISLATVFEKSINAVALFAEQHQVKIECASTDLHLYADANRLVQVLVNLLSNAIKFSPQNSIVSLSAQQSESHVHIEVADRGPGIPPSQAETIFEAYRQVEGQDASKGGTGLGLTICRSIVEAHAGHIGVTSEVGNGSVFWFELPSNQSPLCTSPSSTSSASTSSLSTSPLSTSPLAKSEEA